MAAILFALLASPGGARAEGTLEGLERALSPGDEAARVRALTELSSSVVGPRRARLERALDRAMTDPAPSVRRAALEAWTRLAPNEARGSLFGLLEDPSLEVRRETLRALRRCASGWAEIGSHVVPLLAQPDLRLEAVETLAAAREGRNDVLRSELLRCLERDEKAVLLAALRGLARWSPLEDQHAEPILRHFAHASADVREAAALAFTHYLEERATRHASPWPLAGYAVLPWKLPRRYLFSPSRSDPRPYLVALLAPMDSEVAPLALPRLTQLCVGSDQLGPAWRTSPIRAWATRRFLATRDEPHRDLARRFGDLALALDHGSVPARVRVVRLLHAMPPMTHLDAHALFAKALESQHGAVRFAAVRALGGKYLEERLDTLRCPASGLGEDAFDVASDWLDPPALPAVQRPQVPPNRALIGLLLRASNDPLPIVRLAALIALSEHLAWCSPWAWRRFETGLEDRDPRVRRFAAVGLSSADDRLVGPLTLNGALARVLRSDPIARRESLRAIRRTYRCRLGEAGVAFSRVVLQSDPDPLNRKQAVMLVGFGAYVRARPLVLLASEDSDPRVRSVALRHLAHYTDVDDPPVVCRLARGAREDEEEVARAARWGLSVAAKHHPRGSLWWAVVHAYLPEILIALFLFGVACVAVRRLPWRPEGRARWYLGALIVGVPTAFAGTAVYAVTTQGWVEALLPATPTLLPPAQALSLTAGGIVFGLALWACLTRPKPRDSGARLMTGTCP